MGSAVSKNAQFSRALYYLYKSFWPFRHPKKSGVYFQLRGLYFRPIEDVDIYKWSFYFDVVSTWYRWTSGGVLHVSCTPYGFENRCTLQIFCSCLQEEAADVGLQITDGLLQEVIQILRSNN